MDANNGSGQRNAHGVAAEPDRVKTSMTAKSSAAPTRPRRGRGILRATGGRWSDARDVAVIPTTIRGRCEPQGWDGHDDAPGGATLRPGARGRRPQPPRMRPLTSRPSSAMSYSSILS